jgi:hypothetical protein
MKARTQLIGESLQEFAEAVEQVAHRALVGLPVEFIQREAAHTFVDGVRERQEKQHLLMGGDRSLNEALNHALKPVEAKAAAGPSARLRDVAQAPMGTWPPPVERRRNGRPACWQCGNAGHINRLSEQNEEADENPGNE